MNNAFRILDDNFLTRRIAFRVFSVDHVSIYYLTHTHVRMHVCVRTGEALDLFIYLFITFGI
jgi:hypothetical protein